MERVQIDRIVKTDNRLYLEFVYLDKRFSLELRHEVEFTGNLNRLHYIEGTMLETNVIDKRV